MQTSSSRTAQPTTSEISCPFTRWFDSDGYFVAKPFQQWLAGEIAIIGEADPKSVEAAKKVRDGYVELTDGDIKVTQKESQGNGSGKETPSKRPREKSRKNIKL